MVESCKMNLKCEKSFERQVNVRVCPLATGSIALNVFKLGFVISYVLCRYFPDAKED